MRSKMRKREEQRGKERRKEKAMQLKSFGALL
jgi:hypothetical protein